MATSSNKNIKNPPPLDKSPNFEQWEKSLKYWQAVTDLPKAKQGPAVTLSLSGKALEAAMELDFEEVSGDTGVQKVVERLRKIYAKDKVEAAYEAFDKFIHFKKKDKMNMVDYITEFESNYSKAKTHGFELSDSSQGFFLMNQAGLSDDHKKLVRATITDLSVQEVKSKLSKVFGDGKTVSTTSAVDEISVKVENINMAEDSEEAYFGYNNNAWRGAPRGQYSRPFQSRGGYYQRPFRGYPRQAGRGNFQFKGPSNTDFRARKKCSICESTYHDAAHCPEKTYYYEEYPEESEQYHITLYESNLITQQDFNVFVAEASTSAILDSGATATVVGECWLNSFFEFPIFRWFFGFFKKHLVFHSEAYKVHHISATIRSTVSTFGMPLPYDVIYAYISWIFVILNL